jgi:hypothetical protein
MILAAVFLCFLLPSQVEAIPAHPVISHSTGGLKAEIRDHHGAAVAGVQISLKHPDGRVWVATSDREGRFQAGTLPPADYQVEWHTAAYQSPIHPRVRIRADAWLLGLPPGPLALQGLSGFRLHLVGPATYQYATGLSVPYAGQEIEKIPTH